MLLSHRPSQHLHRASRPAVADDDLADVEITVIPPTDPEPERAAARAVPSGRAAAINRRPPEQ